MGRPVGIAAAEVGHAGPGAVVRSPGGGPQVGAGGDRAAPGAGPQRPGADVEPGHVAADPLPYAVEPGGHLRIAPQAGRVVQHLDIQCEHVAGPVVMQVVHEVVGGGSGSEEVPRQPVVPDPQPGGACSVDMAGIGRRGVRALGELTPTRLGDRELPALCRCQGVVDALLVVRDVHAFQVRRPDAGRTFGRRGAGGQGDPGRGQRGGHGATHQRSPAHVSSGGSGCPARSHRG